MAFLIAPLAIPVGLSLAAVVFPGDSPVSLSDFLGLTALFSLFALPVAYAVELVLGLPAWFVFRRYRIHSWWAFAAGGALLGMVYDLAYEAARYVAGHAFAYDFVRHELTRDLNPLGFEFAIPAGLIAAIMFRAIAFPRQQNRERSELAKS